MNWRKTKMFTFLLGTLGGVALGGGYVLLNTPRSGKENQRFVKDLYYTTKYNIEDVQDKAANFQDAMNTLNTELNYVQMDFVPEIMSSVNSLTEEADVYMRRINDGVNDMKTDVDAMNARIEARKNMED